MNDHWQAIGWATLLLLTFAAVGQVLFFYPQLPAQVASHFDANGNPNGAMSKGTFVAIFLGLEIFTALLFLFMHKLVSVIPIGLVNIPNREYWLKGEQREESINSIAAFSYWIGVITLLLYMILFQLTVLANIQNANLNGSVFWVTVIIFLGLIFASCFWLVRRFRKPAAQA